jgi:hypothetical protein
MRLSPNAAVFTFILSSLAPTIFAQPPTGCDMIYQTVINGRDYDLFLPRGVTDVRGIIFRGPWVTGSSMDIVKYPAYQYLAKRYGYGVLGYDFGQIITDDCIVALKNFSQISTIGSVETAPIYAEGFSNGGGNSWAWVKKYPERVIAYFVNKGVSSSGTLTDEGLDVPGFNCYGDQEGESQVSNQQRLFNDTRSRGGLIALVVQQGSVHTEHDEYTLLSNPYLYQIESIRNPNGALPLSPIRETDGWLGDPDTRHSSMMSVYAYNDYPAGKDKRAACWYPNKDMAYLFSAFCTYDKKIQLTPVDVPWFAGVAGDSARFSVTVNSAVGAIKEIGFYDYGEKVGQIGPDDPLTFTFNPDYS